MPLVSNPQEIRLAMIGMVAENGHPYSWSAVINGYDPAEMSRCPYPVIYKYLQAQPRAEFGIRGVRVTHIWCDDPEDARRVARASLIANVANAATDVIGEVDAVCIPTDIGTEHLERAMPYVESGVPVFIDKPLTDRPAHLERFAQWMREGKPIMSSSALRYAREFVECRKRLSEIGELRLITMTMAKSWERYGMHALEGIYSFLPSGGWETLANMGSTGHDILHAHHASGVEVVFAVIEDMFGGFGCAEFYGTKGHISAQFDDSFHAFKAQLEAFVGYLRSGTPGIPIEETIELAKLLIAGIKSREQGGRAVHLSEIIPAS
jgi:predicted dehydrogenase